MKKRQIIDPIKWEGWLYELVEPFSFERKKHTLPCLGPYDVTLEFHFCGLCGSDLSTFNGMRDTMYPASLGHEFVATIKSVGKEVNRFVIGDIVLSDLNYRCGSCGYCISGLSHLCVEGQLSLFSNRAFGNYSIVNSEYLVKAPTQEAHFRYCLAEPLSCVLHAIGHLNPRVNESILVIGAGSLGLCAAIAFKKSETLVYFHDKNKQRLSKLDKTFNVQIYQDNPSKKYDAVLDLSGSVDGLRLSAQSVKPGGRLVSMSHLDGEKKVDFLLEELTRKDVWFIVSYLNGHKSNLLLAANIIDQICNNDILKLINVEPIERINQTFSSRHNSQNLKTVFDLQNTF